MHRHCAMGSDSVDGRNQVSLAGTVQIPESSIMGTICKIELHAGKVYPDPKRQGWKTLLFLGPKLFPKIPPRTKCF